MKKKILMITTLTMLNACTPSQQYMAGQGFYAENNKFNKHQLNSLSEKGNVKDLGYFSVANGGCGFYTRESADNGVVVPAVKEKLKQLGGNVADGILTKEAVGIDMLLGLLVVPGLLACSNWTITGNAFFVSGDIPK